MTKNFTAIVFAAIGLTVLTPVCRSSAVAADGDWPQWRGPDGTGIVATTDVITNWGPEQNVKWRVDLPEPGNSTPIVWSNHVFLTQPLSKSNQRSILCLDRQSGQERWRRSIDYADPEKSHKTNPYCSASPVTDGERVIAWFGSAGLVCWDFDGNELWRRDLGKQQHMWGYGTSPILHGDLCILNFGPGKRESLLAVNKNTGKTVWEVAAMDDSSERALSGPENDGSANSFNSDKDRVTRLRGSWNTPIVIEVDGHDELVVAYPRRVTAYDPATGKELWTCGGGAPLAYASPMEFDGTVVVLGGYNGASLAVRAGGKGDVTQTHRLWHKPRDTGWLGTGVAHDGAIYICGMDGVLSCIDIQSGDRLWKDRTGSGGTWSSITQTGDGHMFLLTKSGATTVFRPDQAKFAKVAENNLNEKSNASVVVAGPDVIIRTNKAIWCFAKPN